jgi:hypothetical protein
MSTPSDEEPRTVGELRRRLAELGDPWSVDPRLGDDDPLPQYARGGQPDEEVPERAQLSAMAEEADLRELLSSEPPTNPFLRARWAEAGLLPPDDDDAGTTR